MGGELCVWGKIAQIVTPGKVLPLSKVPVTLLGLRHLVIDLLPCMNEITLRIVVGISENRGAFLNLSTE